MTMFLTRRWLIFAVVVGLLAWLAVVLGEWQFHRLDERKAENELLHRNLHAAPVAFEEVLRVGEPVRANDEWRRVTLTGTWDDAHTVVLKYQTRKGQAGVDVVTPLVTRTGAAVLVDRGWLKTGNTGQKRPDTPDAAAGVVTVTGWARRDATGDEARVAEMSARALSSRQVAKVVDYPLYGGFVDLESQQPKAADQLAGHELPDENSEGPHFFYGLQWWFFGALAVFGFFYLAWDERKKTRRVVEPSGDSEGPQHAAVDREHGAGDEG